MESTIRTVGVVGTGVIGASWTGLFLAKGLHVLVSDPAPGAEGKLASHLNEIWPTLKEIGLVEGASLLNYRFVGPSLQDHYGDVDFIQENAPEKLELKNRLIGEIDAGTGSDVIIASSSSGLPSSEFISQCKKNPGRVLIGHPFNPPHLMPLVEVVPHPGTDSKYKEAAIQFYRSLGKAPVYIEKEVPGFAANRLQMALCNEAYSLVKQGVMSAEDVDKCVTTSLGPRWAFTGPFMSNVMGGGGGHDGFKHIQSHIGVSSQIWTDDMKAHSFEFNAANIDFIDKSVQLMLDNCDEKAVEEQRDKLMVALLKAKRSDGPALA